MAVVQGIKEKVHLPIYDAVKVEPEKQLRDVERSGTLKFFVDVQGKTKLETNLQAASLLPHYNTFEARAMRVVISDLPPEFPEEPTAENEEEAPVTDDEDNEIRVAVNADGSIALNADGTLNIVSPVVAADGTVTTNENGTAVTADYELALNRLVELLQEAQEDEEGFTALDADDEDVTLWVGDEELTNEDYITAVADAGGVIWLSAAELEELIDGLGREAPPQEQLNPSNGHGNLLSKFIYNTVTTFYVGEKVMIEMPTWFFPGGAGPYSEGGAFSTHGEPNPTATFRFAEPIFVDKQQNFRVEIDIPDSEVLEEIQKIYGPFFIWVVLDGYMTRDVQ